MDDVRSEVVANAEDRRGVPQSDGCGGAPLSDDAAEMGVLFGRLMDRIRDVGLLSGEIEGLLNLGIGEWRTFRSGRPGWRMTVAQERRARLSIEMLDRLFDLHGDWPAVLSWLTTPSAILEELTPLEWASERPEQLFAVVRTLRDCEQ